MARISPPHYLHQSPTNKDDSNELFLNSPSYSSICPQFRHGPIIIPKSKRFGGHHEVVDDVNWPAFQAAILGTGHTLEDITSQEDAVLAEDISTWFADFGFDHHGLLISALTPTSTMTPASVENSHSIRNRHDKPTEKGRSTRQQQIKQQRC
jgi:hypothetical protein